MKFLLCTPTGEMNNMIREIFIYACILELKITISGHICFFFPINLEALHECFIRVGSEEVARDIPYSPRPTQH